MTTGRNTSRAVSTASILNLADALASLRAQAIYRGALKYKWIALKYPFFDNRFNLCSMRVLKYATNTSTRYGWNGDYV